MDEILWLLMLSVVLALGALTIAWKIRGPPYE